MLIVFCGIDGSGKTTQLMELKNRLTELGRRVYVTKQPTDWYRVDRRVRDFLCGKLEETPELMNELVLLSAADRCRQQNNELIPKQNDGFIVLCDRYVYTAYSYFLARGVSDIDWLKEVNRCMRIPDITFYIDVPGMVAYDRILKRDGESAKREEKDEKRLNLIRENFLSKPWGDVENYYILDGTKPAGVIADEVFEVVTKHMNMCTQDSVSC